MKKSDVKISKDSFLRKHKSGIVVQHFTNGLPPIINITKKDIRRLKKEASKYIDELLS